MILEFEVKNKTLQRKDTNVSIENNEEIICKFFFLTEEWENKEKYVIFWDNKNKTTIQSIGKQMTSECIIPSEITQESIFDIQVYVNHNLYTQKLNLSTTPSLYTKKKTTCHKKEEIRDEFDNKRIFKKLFTELKSKVDAISYENGYLKCFAGEKLIYAEPIFVNLVDDVKEIIKTTNSEIDNIVLEEEQILCYSNNEIIYTIPFTSTLSSVAFSGDYNDLQNIPEEFNPTAHNHMVVDVIDYEENIDIDLNTLLDFLSDEINKE